ncbi:ATP-dependent DNA helicase DinG [Hydrogenobacter hydrogenophilus]|uniref:DNA 5'-3' helicase n=1 Tax=Hydrogenobacter hydrogenophilus TaxID=35835 RepID=A0A285NW05_9AQUI|nr:ATP-dependent DNA helicase DinG [Hydrogenobacter hydrogenophilus]
MLLYEFLLQKGLEKRRVQEKFFQIVLSVMDEGGIKIVQAPTGTGKTYGYLIPIIERGQKAIISTGTKLLQEQLRRDIEVLRSYSEYLLGSQVNYLVIKGRSNYLCLDRYYAEKHQIPQIDTAMENGWDGDFEFVNVDQEIKEKLCVDEDYCTPNYRNLCRYKNECYYWGRLKKLERSADILVVNHALLTLKDFEDTQERILVIDEAHELDRYITNSLTSGISLYTLRVEIMGKIREFLPSADADLETFFIENFEKLFKHDKDQIAIERVKQYAEDFQKRIVDPLESLYSRIKEEVRYRIASFLEDRLFVSLSLKDYLLRTNLITQEEFISIKSTYDELSQEEQDFLRKLKSYELLTKKIIRLKEFLKAMREENQELGFIVSRSWSKKLGTYNYKLECFPVFPAGFVDFDGYKGVIITSATADPEDLKKTLGIVGEYYELEHTLPYYQVHFLVYKVDPKDEDWKDCLFRAYKYLRTLYDKVLILLTNKDHKAFFEREEGLAFQGEENLSKLVEELRAGKIKALVGLDSLWFGVDVKGEKGILMSKLPFESPEDPITFHRIRFLKSIGENPFEYQKRKALIKFRQGIGRLMRSKEDRGTIVLCDRRIFKFKEFLVAVKELGIQVKTVK